MSNLSKNTNAHFISNVLLIQTHSRQLFSITYSFKVRNFEVQRKTHLCKECIEVHKQVPYKEKARNVNENITKLKIRLEVPKSKSSTEEMSYRGEEATDVAWMRQTTAKSTSYRGEGAHCDGGCRSGVVVAMVASSKERALERGVK